MTMNPDPGTGCPPQPPGDRAAWDTDYASRGKLWGGSSSSLPDLPPGSKVLELGCGNGKSLGAMSAKGWDVTGIDFSLPAVGMCRRILGPGIPDVVAADSRILPFRTGAFDAVFAFHVLGHMLVGDRVKSAAEIVRVLGQSGTFHFRAFSVADLRFGKGNEVEDATFVRGTGIPTHYFTLAEAADLFSALLPVSLDSHRWTMRIRGEDLVREEIAAVFSRS